MIGQMKTAWIILSIAFAAGPLAAGEKPLMVPKGGLTIDAVVKADDPKVRTQESELPAKVFLVKLSAKEKYLIEMNAADQKQLDPFLVIQDQAGKELAFDDDGGGDLNARLHFSPTKDGVYKVFAAAFEGAGKFTLKISTEEAVVHTVPKAGLSIDAVVKPDDPKVRVQQSELPAKVFLVKLSALEKYRIEMNAADQDKLDPFLVIHDQAGKELAFDDDGGGGLNARLVFAPPKDGTYRIYAAAFTGAGNFMLKISNTDTPIKLPTVQIVNGPAKAPAVQTVAEDGLTISAILMRTGHKIAVVDPDPKIGRQAMLAGFYLVKLSAKKTYRIAMNAANAKDELDPYLLVLDAAGKVLAFDDDGGGGFNSRLSFLPPKDGVYQILAAALAGEGRYTLRISEEEIIAGTLAESDGRRLTSMKGTRDRLGTSGDFAEALKQTREILALREKLQGSKHWETLDARIELDLWQRRADLPADKQKVLAAVLRGRGDLLLQDYLRSLTEEDREKAYQRIVALHQLSRQTLGEKHLETAYPSTLVGQVLHHQGKFAAAQVYLEKALAIWRESLGEKHPETATGYLHAALNLDRQNQYAAAQALYQKALDIRLAAFGELHPDTAATYHSIGVNVNYQGKFKEAYPILQKALAIQRKLLGEKHAETANYYNSIGGNLADRGLFSAAHPLYQKALDIRLELLGENHTDTAISYHNVGSNLSDLGKYTAAEPLLEKALQIWRRELGEKHPNTALSWQQMAINLNTQGKHAAAQLIYQKVLDIRLEVLGEKHRDTAMSYHLLGWNLEDQGKYVAARPMIQKALDIRLSVLGEKHPETAQSYNEIALNLDFQGQHAAAQPLFEKAIAIGHDTVGEQHRDTITTVNNLAINLIMQRQYAAAQRLQEKNLALCLDRHGEKHHNTARMYHNLAKNLTLQHRQSDALPLFQKAFDIRREVLGDAHPDTGVSGNYLASSLHALGKYAEAEKALQLAVTAHNIAWVDRAASGFDRAIGSERSPRPRLAALLARRGEALDAWQHAEADLGRGLLDDLAEPSGKVEQDPKALLPVLRKLDEQLVPLLANDLLDDEQKEWRDKLLRERQALLDDLSAQAAKRAAQRVVSLAKIQQHLPADAALVLWIDAAPEYWACVVRKDGPPRWEALPGAGAKGDWTDNDREVHLKLYDALATPAKIAEGEQKLLTSAFLKQRFEPLRKHLQAAGQLRAVRKLLFVPTGAMARIPLEALLSDFTISYVPSGSVFARLAEQHRPLQASPLLALGDPIFAPPAAKTAPPPANGLFVQMVLPGSNAARNGLQAGDVLLSYNDMPLKTLADLKLASGGMVKVLFWRDGKEQLARLQSGNLGAVFDKQPAAEAVVAWRRTRKTIASLRGTGHQRLPATRFETEALARLVGMKQATLLLGSDASEQALDRLGKTGLKEFRLLHFATHGDVDLGDPYRSALILAQDQLPDSVLDSGKGAKVYDGRLTVATILRDWDLDADLVVLSACQTGLGKSAEGEGLLGFAQAFLQKGARSVLLSRWKVDDTATALLMLRFYENALGKRKDLKAPLGRAEALEEARTWLRTLSRADAERLTAQLTGGVMRGTERDELPPVKTGKANLPPGKHPFGHPFYWSSFVLVGDPN